MSFTDNVVLALSNLQRKATRGLSLPQASELYQDFLHLLVEEAATLAKEGEDKKDLVLTELGNAFDALAAGIPIPLLLQPVWFLAKPYVKKLILAASSGLIEATYKRLKAALDKLVPPAPAPEPAPAP